jgi:hypothetical protein
VVSVELHVVLQCVPAVCLPGDAESRCPGHHVRRPRREPRVIACESLLAAASMFCSIWRPCRERRRPHDGNVGRDTEAFACDRWEARSLIGPSEVWTRLLASVRASARTAVPRALRNVHAKDDVDRRRRSHVCHIGGQGQGSLARFFKGWRSGCRAGTRKSSKPRMRLRTLQVEEAVPGSARQAIALRVRRWRTRRPRHRLDPPACSSPRGGP